MANVPRCGPYGVVHAIWILFLICSRTVCSDYNHPGVVLPSLSEHRANLLTTQSHSLDYEGHMETGRYRNPVRANYGRALFTLPQYPSSGVRGLEINHSNARLTSILGFHKIPYSRYEELGLRVILYSNIRVPAKPNIKHGTLIEMNNDILGACSRSHSTPIHSSCLVSLLTPQ